MTHICPLDMAINAFPRREKGTWFFCVVGISHMQSLRACEIPREISKARIKEGWM